MSTSFREIETGPPGRRLPGGAVRSAAVTRGGGIAVEFRDESVSFDPSWLRDNCRCDECRIRQTDERRWQPWLDPSPAVAGNPEAADGDLVVRWSSGHVSRFTRRDWDDIDRAMRRGRTTLRLWQRGYEIERFDHDSSTGDLDVRRRLFAAFRRDGAVIVTGAPCVPGAAIDTLRALGITVRDSSLGLIFDVVVDPEGYNVAYTAEAVPPHNDNAQYAHPPSGQVLAMLVNDASGGDSIVVDGWSVLDHLRMAHPEAVDALTRVDVGFRQYSRDVEAFTRAPLVVLDSTDWFTQLRFSNQLMQPLPFDTAELADWYAAYRLLGAALCDPSNHVTFRLRAGEMLFVNGYRVLHARSAFTPDALRHLQDVYFDIDDVLGILARMDGEATDAMAHP